MKRRGVLAALLVALAAQFKSLHAEPWKPVVIDLPYQPTSTLLADCRVEGTRGTMVCDPVEIKHIVLIVRYGKESVSLTGEEIMKALKGRNK